MKTAILAPSILLGLSLASGCMRWHGVPMPPPHPGGESYVLDRARVTTLPDPGGPVRERMVLRHVEVRGDSLIGWRAPVPRPSRRIAVPRDQVVGLELGEISGWRTIGAMVLSVLAAYAAYVAYMMTQPMG